MTREAAPPDDLRHVRETLHTLRAEIASAANLDAPRRQRALREIDEISAVLGAPAAEASRPDSRGEPLERLERLALEFEASHPTAAELVQRVASLLSSMGI